MTYIGVKELRQNLNKYAQRVRKGEGFIVMKHNKPLFQITPVKADKWGEEGWESVVDFTEIDPQGVPFDDVLRALKKLKARDKARNKSGKRG